MDAKQLKLNHVEAAVVSLYFGKIDTPTQERVAMSLGVTVHTLRRTLGSDQRFHYWRQYRDLILADHGRVELKDIDTIYQYVVPTKDTERYAEETLNPQVTRRTRQAQLGGMK